MPSLRTPHFGVLDYQAGQMIQFPDGLPAFEDQREFIAVEQSESAPIIFLQSLNRPELVFMTIPAHFIDPGYRLMAAEEDLAGLGLAGQQQSAPNAETLVLAIVTVAANQAATVNLKAPVVVNLATRRAAQIIQSEADYSFQHPLLRPETSC
jgi:flagellar assembly factor FliW